MSVATTIGTSPGHAAVLSSELLARCSQRAAGYDRDNTFYLEWDAIARDADTLEAWLQEWVYGLENHTEYVEKWGDAHWDALRPGEALSGEVDYGRYA